MSLESGLKELGEKIDNLIGLMQQDIDLRKTALEKIADATAKASGTKPKADDKPKSEDKPKAEDKPKETEKSGDDAGDDLLAKAKKLVAQYVGGAAENSDERKARNKKVVALLSDKRVKKADAPETVKDLKDVNPKALNAVIKKLGEYIEAGDITKPAEEDGDISLED